MVREPYMFNSWKKVANMYCDMKWYIDEIINDNFVHFKLALKAVFCNIKFITDLPDLYK